MAASPFERQVIEDNATDDHTPAKPTMADAPQQFQPTPSFVDHDRPTIRLVELPAWLQAFASSVGEPSELEAPAATESNPSDPAVSSSSPDPKEQEASQPRTTDQRSASGVNSDFISEDDLPEWLRSIAPEESVDRSFDSLGLGGDDDREQITVPNITRAWSTSKDARGVDETTSLFQLVASQAPQTALPDQPANGIMESGSPAEIVSSTGEVTRYGTDIPPGDAASIQMPEPMESESADAEISTRFPILPIAVAGILLLVLVGAAVIMFL